MWEIFAFSSVFLYLFPQWIKNFTVKVLHILVRFIVGHFIFFDTNVNGNVSMIFFSIYLLVVYRKVTELHKLILCPAILASLLIICTTFLVEDLEFIVQNVIASVNRDSMTSFCISIPFVFFSWLIAPVSTLRKCWKGVGMMDTAVSFLTFVGLFQALLHLG